MKRRNKTVEVVKEIVFYATVVLYLLVVVTIAFGALKLLKEGRLLIPCFNIWEIAFCYILASIVVAVLIYTILQIKRENKWSK